MSSMPPSKGSQHTSMALTAKSKQIKAVFTDRNQPADISTAPTSRVYTNDYSKVQEDKDSDQVSVYLGNPLRW